MKTLEDMINRVVRVIDISSRMKDFPEFAPLSNLGAKPFVMDGVECACLEGFLQALKTPDRERQVEICAMNGPHAKCVGAKIIWQDKQTLYWCGRAYGRHTQEYQELISRAYQACYDQCEEFRRLLAQTGNAILEHSIGKTDPTQTILTIDEFVGRLERLREKGTLLVQ